MIGDFGLAGVMSGPAPAAYMPHVPAAVLDGELWTRRDDIYALAVTGWRLLGAPPMPVDIATLEDAVRSGTWPDRSSWPSHVHSRLRRTLRAAMHPDASKRPATVSEFREGLLASMPMVSWAADGPLSWQGTDNQSSYKLQLSSGPQGWLLEVMRDRGAGSRRLGKASVPTRTEQEYRTRATAILELLASEGITALSKLP